MRLDGQLQMQIGAAGALSLQTQHLPLFDARRDFD